MKENTSQNQLDPEDNDRTLAEAYGRVLNSHGYAFQHSVIRVAETLYREGRTQWIFEASEFPVNVRGKDTRIDLIMRKRDSRIHIIGECKRANPALSNWCFARVPYLRRNPNPEKILVEYARRDIQGRVVTGVESDRSQNIYHLGLEVKTHLKGDEQGTGRGAIEQAAGQVCLGVNGMVEFLSTHNNILGGENKFFFVPVIFTTAKIWTSTVDLGSADVEKGELELGSNSLTEASWIWLQYHLSPALRHSMVIENTPSDLGGTLENEFARTIAIVSPRGMDEFFQRDWF